MTFKARGAQADRIGDPAEPRTASPSDPEEPRPLARRPPLGRQPADHHLVLCFRLDRRPDGDIGVFRPQGLGDRGAPAASYTFWDEKAEKEVRIEQIEAATVRLRQLR